MIKYSSKFSSLKLTGCINWYLAFLSVCFQTNWYNIHCSSTSFLYFLIGYISQYFSFILVCFWPYWYDKLPFTKFSSLLLTCYFSFHIGLFSTKLISFLPYFLLLIQPQPFFLLLIHLVTKPFFFIPTSFLLNWCDKLHFYDNWLNNPIIVFHPNMFSTN